jgi:hypothetical protein
MYSLQTPYTSKHCNYAYLAKRITFTQTYCQNHSLKFTAKTNHSNLLPNQPSSLLPKPTINLTAKPTFKLTIKTNHQSYCQNQSPKLTAKAITKAKAAVQLNRGFVDEA